MKANALMALLMLWGCASEVPGTGEREYRRADTLIEAAEEFELRKRRCTEAGGVLQVRRMTGSRQPPRVREMKAATCAMANSSAGIY